jgi:hypothetical protein
MKCCIQILQYKIQLFIVQNMFNSFIAVFNTVTDYVNTLHPQLWQKSNKLLRCMKRNITSVGFSKEKSLEYIYILIMYTYIIFEIIYLLTYTYVTLLTRQYIIGIHNTASLIFLVWIELM